MTSAQAMDIIYPLCTALFGGYLLLKIVFLIYVKRTWVVMFDAFILLTETVVLGLFAILTDENPRMDIEQYRFLVTSVTLVLKIRWLQQIICMYLVT